MLQIWRDVIQVLLEKIKQLERDYLPSPLPSHIRQEICS